MNNVKIVCTECGSDDVRRDAWAVWDVARQEFILAEVYDDGYCMVCEEHQTLDEVPI